MASAAKSMVVKVGTDGSVYNNVDDINSASMNHSGNNLDITKFTASYIRRLQGLKDASYSLGGFYNPADTNGQLVIRTAFIADSALYIQFLPDGTNGFEQQVKVSAFNISGSVDGPVEVSIELEGHDAVSLVP